MSTKVHDLKIWPEFFAEIASGLKSFEIRKNDRDYRVGDTLILKEFEEHFGYSDRELTMQVTHLLHGGQFGLQSGFVCMSIKLQREPS